MAGTSRKADPLFADDLQLRTGSPAIGSGTAESVQRRYITDLAGRAVYAAVVDIGAYTCPPATPPPSRLPPATPFPPALPPPPPSRFAPVSPSGLSPVPHRMGGSAVCPRYLMEFGTRHSLTFGPFHALPTG